MEPGSVPSRCVLRRAALAVLAGFMIVLAEAVAQAQVPTVNIQKTCQAAAGVMVSYGVGAATEGDDVRVCLDSENKAREQLIKEWATFPLSDRDSCIQTRGYLPSYIEWLTCFEMNKIVREGRQKGRSMGDFLNPDGSMTLPPVCSLGINMCGYSRGRYGRY
jgi:hypothetical protein